MKTSKRYLSGTLLAILTVPVLIVAYSRIVPSTWSQRLPERTPAAELAALGSFTAIEVEGDFALEITGAADFSVSYEALVDTRGDFVARIENGTLYLRGFGNRSRETGSRVLIGVPALQSLNVQYAQALRVSNLDTTELNMRIVAIPSVTLENNRINDLEVSGYGVESIAFEGNAITSSQLRVVGETTITTSD